MRSNCDLLKSIFCHHAKTSIQNSGAENCLKKEEIKRMMQAAALAEKNGDLLVEECFNQLKLRDDAVFYYEFLNIVQWLAITSVASEKEPEDIDNDEEESEIIVQKMKYLVDKLAPVT